MLARLTIALLGIVLASAALAQDAPKIKLEPVVLGLKNPVYVWHDGSDRLYVVEQRGTIRLVEGGKLQPQPFLDITSEVQSGGECGLLSVAFSPKFSEDGLLYVNYTQRKGKLQTIIAEFRAERGAKTAAPETQRVIMSIDQPFANHNGGHIIFGPDGMLYIGMGDGGAANDPHNNAQNPQSLLGKILRINPSAVPYSIPRDNPFVADPRFRPEIWSLGLRNPWRMCFDPESGAMITGDVGQNVYEEVAIVKPGENHGWRPREGLHPNPSLGKREEPISTDVDPIVEYEHRTYPHQGYGRAMVDNCIIGGFVYRGEAFPALVGWYLYADYNSGRIWGLQQRRGKLVANELLLETTIYISSFGEDRSGEIYVCDHQRGAILRVVAE